MEATNTVNIDKNLNGLKINIYHIVIIMIMILFIAIIILYVVNPDKSFSEFISINISNNIPISNKYKDIISSYIPSITNTPYIIIEKLIESAPTEIINNVCTNIDIQKNNIIDKTNENKKEEEIKITSDNIKKFYTKTDKTSENINTPNNEDNDFYNTRPWDDILDECKNMHGTIDDIDWKNYVFGSRPKIILY